MSKRKIYTVADTGNRLLQELKNQGTYPEEFLDYAKVTGDSSMDVCDSDIWVSGDLRFGNNEGIYLDISLDGYYSIDNPNTCCHKQLLTFKTLYETKDALYEMAKLQASCMIALREHLAEHADDYERRGYKCIKPAKQNEVSVSVYCETKERTEKYREQSYLVMNLLTGKLERE